MKSIHPALEAAFIFLLIAMVLAVADATAQDNYITCRYIPTGAIQTFKGTQCPNDWHPL